MGGDFQILGFPDFQIPGCPVSGIFRFPDFWRSTRFFVHALFGSVEFETANLVIDFMRDVYLAAYLRVLDDEVRSDTLMFFNSRKSHTFSVIQQLKTIGLLPARAWQQQSTKGALLWPVNCNPFSTAAATCGCKHIFCQLLNNK